MTQEEKAKAYDEAIERAKDALNDGAISYNTIVYLQDVFPELKESEDDRMRKGLITFLEYVFYSGKNANFDKWGKSDCSDWLIWLEKQDKKVDAIENFDTEFEKQVSHLLASALNKDYEYTEGFVKWVSSNLLGYAKYEIEKQGEQKPVWSEDDENEFNHIIHILNLAEEEQEIKGYNNLIGTVDWFKSIKDKIQSNQSNKPQDKSALEVINEKPVDNANKVQPKFNVGDWIVYDDNICKIMKMSLDDKFYHCYGIKNHLHIYNRSLENEIHLWTIQDAMDGDIIYAKSKFNDFSYICIFFKLENGKSWGHCYITSKDSIHWNFEYSKGFLRIDGHDFYPASKEQRDLLFYKMKESDYKWDFESKEVTPLF